MRKLSILLAILLVSCGLFQAKTKTEIMANEPAKLEVGHTWRYRYISSESSRAVKDSALVVSIEAIDEENVTILIAGYVKLTLGDYPIASTQTIPKHVLTLGYLQELRQLTGAILPTVVVQWQGWTPEGCDSLKLSSIVGAEGVEITAKVCAQSLTVPTISAEVEDLGIKIAYANVI